MSADSLVVKVERSALDKRRSTLKVSRRVLVTDAVKAGLAFEDVRCPMVAGADGTLVPDASKATCLITGTVDGWEGTDESGEKFRHSASSVGRAMGVMLNIAYVASGAKSQSARALAKSLAETKPTYKSKSS